MPAEGSFIFLVVHSTDPLVVQKALASDDGLHEIPQTLIAANHFLGDPVDARSIATIQFTADGVGEQFLREATGEGSVLRG